LKMFELLATIIASCPHRDAQSLKFHWDWMNGRCQDVLVEQSKIGEKLRNENARLHRIPREDTLRTWLEHDWFLYYVLFFVLCISSYNMIILSIHRVCCKPCSNHYQYFIKGQKTQKQPK
jgi:hypothetical protein